MAEQVELGIEGREWTDVNEVTGDLNEAVNINREATEEALRRLVALVRSGQPVPEETLTAASDWTWDAWEQFAE